MYAKRILTSLFYTFLTIEYCVNNNFWVAVLGVIESMNQMCLLILINYDCTEM